VASTPAPARLGPLDVAVRLALFALGVAYGAWALWAVPVRLFGWVEGLSLVITAVATLAAGLLAAWGLQSWRAPLWPIAGWLVVTFVFSMSGPGGDVVVPGGLTYDPGVVKVGEFNWLAGLLAAGLTLFLSYRRYGVPPGSGYTSRANRPTQRQ